MTRSLHEHSVQLQKYASAKKVTEEYYLIKSLLDAVRRPALSQSVPTLPQGQAGPKSRRHKTSHLW